MKLIKEINNLVEAEKAFVLSKRQKEDAVNHMHELVKDEVAPDAEEAAYLSLENVAGFETAPGSVLKKTAKELVGMYKEKFKK